MFQPVLKKIDTDDTAQMGKMPKGPNPAKKN